MGVIVAIALERKRLRMLTLGGAKMPIQIHRVW